MTWFLYSILALFSWGLWGFFSKVSTFEMHPLFAVAVQGVLSAFIGSILYFMFAGNSQAVLPPLTKQGMFAIAMFSVCGVAGNLFYLFALTRGATGVVTMLTALYPLVTLFLAYVFLGEQLSLRQSLGMLLALCGLFLMA